MLKRCNMENDLASFMEWLWHEAGDVCPLCKGNGYYTLESTVYADFQEDVYTVKVERVKCHECEGLGYKQYIPKA